MRSATITFAAVLGAFLSATAVEAGDMKGMRMKAGRSAAADRAYMASMDRMMKGMAVKPTGDPDRDFVDMMTPHHQGAIEMAKVELRYGTDPTLRKLAAGIVRAQEREIAEMSGWKVRHAR